MARTYRPYPVDVYMSRYGYWVVVLSVAPWLRMSVMVCKVGLTSENAIAEVTSGYGTASHRRPMP